MKNILRSLLCNRFNFFAKFNTNLFVSLLFFGFLLSSNSVHAQLPIFDSFEGNFGTWNDGGGDADRVSSTLLNGIRNIQLRDNSGEDSSIYTDDINLASYSSVTIDFLFYANSMENGEDFFVEFDNGSGYVEIGNYVIGAGYNNNVIYNPSITIASADYAFSTSSRFRIRCDASGNSDYIYVDDINITGVAGLYCIPNGTNSSYHIDDFSTSGGVTNITNDNTGYSTSGYGNYINLSVSQYAGSSIDFYANFIDGSWFSSGFGVGVWVDYNNDGDFNDANETQFNNGYYDPINGSFTIPTATPPGDYRMRIVADWNDSTPSSCNSSFIGEAEDYILTVLSIPPCTEPSNQPTNLTFSNIDNSSLDGSFTAATSSPDSYLVIYSTNSTPPTISDATTYTIGSTFSDYTVADTDNNTSFSVSGLDPNTTYYFYIYSFNESCSGGPDYLVTNPLTGDETTDWYCTPSATDSSRYINDFSTTGGFNNISNLSSGYSSGGYGNFTSLSVSQYANSSINFSANFNGGTFGLGIWVDFNNDGDFSDTGEQVYLSGFYGDPISSSFTIPAATAVGSYRMRIVADWGDRTPSPCSISSSGGEAEDYTLTVTAPCSISYANGTSDLGCPFVQLGGLGLGSTAPPPVACSIPETTIEANYLELGDTSSYNVESIPYNPPFQFSCLENAVSVNQDDVWSPEITLPFNFCFYGNTYSSIVIGSNGVISFDADRLENSPSGWRTTRDIPNTKNAGNSGSDYYFGPSIYGAHHDVDPSVGGEIGYQLINLDSGCQALVAAWSDVPMFYDNSILYSGMIVFYENTNIIEVYIKDKNIDAAGSPNFGSDPWNDGNAAIGIQKDSGSATVAPGRNTLDPNWTATNEAWRFVPSGPAITELKWYEGPIADGIVIPDPNNDNQITVTPSTTTTYFAEVTYTLCNGDVIKESNSTTVTVDGQKTWNGSQSTAWENANNWTPVGVPVASDCILIPVTGNDPVIQGSTDGLGYNLEIEDGAVLTQQSNSTLTIEDVIIIKPTGDFEINDSASVIQIKDVATNQNTGSARVQREVAALNNFDYVYWSTPVETFDVSNVSPSTPYYSIFEWIPTVDNGSAGKHGEWTYASGNMALGQGYAIRDLEGTPLTDNAEFEGKLNNGQITHYITRGTYNGGNYAGIGNTSNAEDDNWNLMGNPYPSAISLTAFTSANPYIDGTLYFWRHTAAPSTSVDDPFYEGFQYNYSENDYLSANSLGSTPPGFNGYIASGQGFFVQLLHSSPRPSGIVFNNGMRGVYANDEFYRGTNENTVTETVAEEKHRIWLDLIDSNDKALSVLVGYASGATDEIDRLFDGYLLNDTNYQFYSILNDTEKENKLTINGKALPFDDADIIPLGYQAPAQGQFTIALNTVDGLFAYSDQNIYLEDTELNIIHDLKANPYIFTTDLGVFKERFLLRFTSETLSIADQEIMTNVDIRALSQTIEATSTQSFIKTFELFDITGRLIHKKLNVENINYSYPTNNLSSGTYVVTVSLANGGTLSKKVMVKQP
ncbi:putative secreted protein (Por secretion system target) [Winogradskyella eximia]|uniref:Putative secreted protein (Por secretion system target) n=1 Tax=Winogradskyella eximia TaxID=262006 RepID=A0A3D9H2A1_9FLAO|nr:GEVED domain-containing protein [Winogradskyella eximia]RED43291.1 putative secreted protein (Por secretion system target) [Winogradskyella eximia]